MLNIEEKKVNQGTKRANIFLNFVNNFRNGFVYLFEKSFI